MRCSAESCLICLRADSTIGSMTTASNTRLHYFDGIRGIAALVVLNEHFLKLFAPSAYIDEAQWPLGSPGLDWLTYPPFNLLGNGAPAVTIFFVLSGWVLSRYIYREERVYWWAEGLKRYLRLMLPCLASLLLIYVVMLMSDFGAAGLVGQLGSKEATFRSFGMGFGDVVEQGLVGTIFLQDFRLNPPLWTLSVEFYGAIVIFGLAGLWGRLQAGGYMDRRAHHALQLIVPFGMLFVTTTSLMFGIFLGMFLHAVTTLAAVDRLLQRTRGWWTWLAAAVGFLLLAYMIRGSFQNPYIHISFWGMSKVYEYAYNAVGAGLILLAAHYSPVAQKILSHSFLLWLGKISFAMYLTHYIVLMTLGTWLASKQGAGFAPGETFVLGAVVIPSVIVVAAIFEKLVDAPSIKLARASKETVIGLGAKVVEWVRINRGPAPVLKDNV